MLIEVLFGCAVVLAALSRLQPHLDRTLVWLLGLVLILAAATRTGGFDYVQYVTMIDGLRTNPGAGFLEKLSIAKNPFFLWLIEGLGIFFRGSRAVFVVVAIVSVITKVSATRVLGNKRTIFLALYTIFLAPGLEFAAIRAAMAIGVLMLAYTFFRKTRLLLWLMALAAHEEVIVTALGRYVRGKIRIWKLASTVVGLVVLVAVIGYLVKRFPDYRVYLNNAGTVYAWFPPLVTLAIITVAGRCDMPVRDTRARYGLVYFAFPAALVNTLAAIVLVPFSVTISFRILGVAMVFLLVHMVGTVGVVKVTTYQRLMRVYVSWTLFLVLLAFFCVKGNLWITMMHTRYL